ncbi:MAG: tetratricopeptide repeat protein, partial [Flavobacteriales bacterium]
MKQHDTLSHKLIARILLAGLFLQSCYDFSNPVVPQVEKLADSNQELTHNQTLTNRVSIDSVVPLTLPVALTAHGGHVVSFYEEQGKLRADVAENLAGNFQKKYPDLPVYVGDDFCDDFDLAQMEKLDPKHQRQLVAVQLPQGGQQGYVYIGKRGLLGGMKRTITKKGDEEEGEKEKEKEYEVAKPYESPNLSGCKRPRTRTSEQKEATTVGSNQSSSPNGWRKIRKLTSSKLQDEKEEAKFQKSSQQLKLKKHIVDQVFKPADHQKIGLALYLPVLIPLLPEDQRTNLAELINHPDDQFGLGLMYVAGHGVEKDVVKAMKLYLKSAEQGHAAAQCNLGFMYATGSGVEKDEVKAVLWYLRSAEQGDAAAQC